MGVKERREREKVATRDKILDAARDLFLANGYDGVSMRKVAEKIEYSPTAIYVHFADKRELFRELCYEDFARLAEAFRGMAALRDPLHRLKDIGRAYVKFGLQFPNHYKLMFMTPHPCLDLDERDRRMKGNPERDAYAFLKQTVGEAIKAGVFRRGLDDAELAAQTLWSSMHGVVSLHIAKQDDPWVAWRPINKRVELALDSILRGMMKTPR